MQESIRNIEHPGIVDHVEGREAFVRIQPQSACGSCHSKSHCSMSEVSDKVVEVSLNPQEQLTAGQPVTITLERSLGFRALFLGYMLPFLILLVSLFVLVSLTGNEGLSALIAIALMAPYYFLLYRFREKIRNKFRFRIK
ncbi:MAG: SoxR reducing system RseC family protein [Bacteroidales bacterium]|nr:SoxR reducing system RseC family protein [Bacteroidales bacterium]